MIVLISHQRPAAKPRCPPPPLPPPYGCTSPNPTPTPSTISSNSTATTTNAPANTADHATRGRVALFSTGMTGARWPGTTISDIDPALLCPRNSRATPIVFRGRLVHDLARLGGPRYAKLGREFAISLLTSWCKTTEWSVGSHAK